ncbi:MAG TPA: glycosyltransferase family 4 protein [Candidatus Synoicihabitans sp.]|nr:glycosyltransferase family 4 protein [Candidatus Synoicihabitans sp.]
MTRRWSGYSGIFFDDYDSNSAWIREVGVVRLPPLGAATTLVLEGERRVIPETQGSERGFPSLECHVDGRLVGVVSGEKAGRWQIKLPVPAATSAEGAMLEFRLRGVRWTNLLAWAGRITKAGSLQRFRAQRKNRQLRLHRLLTEHGEIVYDFSNRHAPYSPAFARAHATLGLNIVGFLTADLGVGESARCMVRAADAATLPAALVDLKLNVKNRRGDPTYAARLQETAPHPVSVFHLDPPAARDIDHHHGRAFRAGRYNVAYWAWELPEFPPAWATYCQYFDEIWCPSDFVREAVAMQAPVPVLTMPHAIAFERPSETTAELRARLGLPPERLLYLFVYDLNSYSPRKNPEAVIAAFREARVADQGAALVIKTHNVGGNESDLAALRRAVADLPSCTIIDSTLSRADTYRLQAACDVFVSLHRSEGFGLSVAESMFLGKPVITTNWSATAEYADASNAAPVNCRLVPLERNIGPYAKGQIWAEPEIGHAASWIARLAGEPGLRARLGAAARATIERRFAPAVVGARYRRRLEAIATR